MIKLTILIPFPINISISPSTNVLLGCLLVLWVSSLFTNILRFFREQKPTTRAERNEICSGTTTTTPDLVLSDDILAEILCRLPPKHMVRCKLLSKSFNKLISDVCIPIITSPIHSFFVPNETSREGPVLWDSTNLSFAESCFRSLPFPFKFESLIDCCNGFLLFRDDVLCLLYVCNPSTEQITLLPRPPQHCDSTTASLTFNPHFNVTIIMRDPLKMLIYSSVTREWTETRVLYLKESILSAGWASRYIFFDGSLHILSKSRHLLKFDVKQVSARGIKLPSNFRGRGLLGCMGVSKGCFHYSWTDPNTCQNLVWTLNEHHWVLKHTFSPMDFAIRPTLHLFDGSSSLFTFAFHPTSDLIFIGNKGKIFSFHPSQKTLECVYRVSSGLYISDAHLILFPFTRNLANWRDFGGGIKEEPISG